MLQIDTFPPHPFYHDTAVVDTQAVCAYDTLFTPLDSIKPVMHKSLFTHHALQVQHSHETAIQHQATPSWYFFFIVLSILLTSLFFRSKQIRIVDLLMPAVNHRALDRLLRDINLTRPINQFPIAFLMLLPLTLVLYFAYIPHAGNDWMDILQYVIFLAAALLVYILRNSIFRFIGSAFNNPESMHFYLSSNYIFHLLYAVATTVFSFFVIYTDIVSRTILYVLFWTLGILFAIRLIRGMQLILTLSKSPKLYLFSYLCILEIVPIIIVIKVLTTI